jgi:prepilin-type N-terminal cleavage/methylation domain-containing protein
MGSAMPRKGYTLVEVLMALFLLAFGLLAMLVLITAGIFQTMRQGQDLSVEYTSENAHSLVRLVLNSQPPTASFQWYYQPQSRRIFLPLAYPTHCRKNYSLLWT